MSVNREQRHTKGRRCPICDGCDGDPRGVGRRCHGFTTADGEWVHCSREDLAGSIDMGPDQCFAHRMRGPCKCGQTHGADRPRDDAWVTYDYRNAAGALVFQVVRKPGKQFLQRQPDGAGGWIWNLQGVKRCLYRTPDIVANPAKVVHIVEGEKDADTLTKHGYLATTNPGGAGKWRLLSEDAVSLLAGRDVIVIADNDDPGHEHARQVEGAAARVAKSVRVMRPPAPHKDVTDMFEGGKGLLDLVELAPAGNDESPKVSRVHELAPEIPFDEIWTPEPDVNLVVPGMGICPGPAHLVTGSWYTGKTLFLLAMGFAVASGKDVFGIWRTQRGRWRHLDHEMGRRGIKRYAQRSRLGLGLSEEDLRGWMNLHPLPRLNLCHPEAVDLYSELLDGYSLCTIDPLRAAAPGQNENDSEYRQWIDLLNVVSDRTGCAIMLLHHGGKPTDGAQRRNTGRGTSAIDDAVQSKFVLTAEEKKAPIHVSHEKTRELADPLDDFWLEIVSDPSCVRLVHRDGEEFAQMNEQRASRREVEALARAKVRVREAISARGGTFLGRRVDLTKIVPGDRNANERAVTEMIASGELKSEGRGESRAWHSL